MYGNEKCWQEVCGQEANLLCTNKLWVSFLEALSYDDLCTDHVGSIVINSDEAATRSLFILWIPHAYWWSLSQLTVWCTPRNINCLFYTRLDSPTYGQSSIPYSVRLIYERSVVYSIHWQFDPHAGQSSHSLSADLYSQWNIHTVTHLQY